MDTKELKNMSAAELIKVHNFVNPKNPIKSWKKAKSDLISIILGLGYGKAPKSKPKPEPKKVQSDSTLKSKRTIRVAALELMCQVDYYEDKTKKPGLENRVNKDHPKARSVGFPYLTIIEKIMEEFPEAQTSVACLRWYGVKARADEFGFEEYNLVQRRPRANVNR